MSFWSTLFKSDEQQILPYPPNHFGRYSDYKTPAQRAAWERSRKEFEQKRYVPAFEAFMAYLADEAGQYVHWEAAEEGVTFGFQQGSRRITGYANEHEFKAEARIALANTLHVGFLRRLVEHNFHFEYCRYALTDAQEICLIFSTFSADASPYKLFYALKELATHADKQDDLLLEEFSGLSPTHQSNIVAISDGLKAAKYAFLQAEIARVLQVMDTSTLDLDRYAKGFSFLLLNLAFRLDYLLRAEGHTMEAIERMSRHFFESDQKTVSQKNLELRREMKKIVARTAPEFYRELYLVGHTFGITVPENHTRFATLVESELGQMDWYAQHGHPEIALSIPGYLVGYALFSFALPRPIKDFLELYMCINDAAFIGELGYQVPYTDSRGKLVGKQIKRAVQQVVDYAKVEHPNLKPNINALQFGDKIAFARTYLTMLQGLDLTKMS